MKILAVILRVLVGFPFVVFGADHFLHFLSMPAPKLSEPAQHFIGALASTPYMHVVKVLELVGGALVLSGRCTPLGLVLLVPVTVNIALWDALFVKYAEPPLGTIFLVMEIVLIWLYRPYFAPLFTTNAKPAGSAVP